MCPSSQESTRLASTSVMSYKAVTASKPKVVSEATRKNPTYKTTKKNEKHHDEWQSQLDQSDNLNPSHLTTQSGSVNQLNQNNYYNNYQNNYSNTYSVPYAEKVTSQVRGVEPNKATHIHKVPDTKNMENTKNDNLKSSDTNRSSDGKHAVLTEEELATFRTSFCTKHHQNKCPNSDSCEKSHCLTWQRRNPYEISYCPHLCPEIQFVKKSRKMVLYRRCTRGKNCNFAHSKEEELYHPLVYKTKQCSAYPKCSRYFCPFVHDPSETRDASKFKTFSDSLNKDTATKEAPAKENAKEEVVDTSFEFDCLDTLNDPETFRDNSYDTFNPSESSYSKDFPKEAFTKEAKEVPGDSEPKDTAPNNENENTADKSDNRDEQLTQFEGDLGMWYDLPNLGVSEYNDTFKPMYEPYQPEDYNPTERYVYQDYQPGNYPNTYQENYTQNYQEQDEYYDANYPNLSATTSTANNYAANKDNFSSTSTTYPAPGNNYTTPPATYMENIANIDSNYVNYYNYQENYEDYANNYEYYNQDYNYNDEYNYDFGPEYLQYNQDLDEQFNTLNLSTNPNSNANSNLNSGTNSKKEDDYSLNDMLAKFINEIGEK